MSDQARLQREKAFKYTDDNGTEKTFILKEPTTEHHIEVDFVKAQKAMKLMESGIKTDDEIFEMLDRQKRFSITEWTDCYKKALDEQGRLISEMTFCNNIESLDKLKFESDKNDKEITRLLNKRFSFTKHSLDTKLENFVNLCLVALSLTDSYGKHIFLVQDEFGNIDYDQSYNNLKSHKDIRFVNTCFLTFKKFTEGIDDTEDAFEKIGDLVYGKTKKALMDLQDLNKDNKELENQDNQETAVVLEDKKQEPVSKTKEKEVSGESSALIEGFDFPSLNEEDTQVKNTAVTSENKDLENKTNLTEQKNTEYEENNEEEFQEEPQEEIVVQQAINKTRSGMVPARYANEKVSSEDMLSRSSFGMVGSSENDLINSDGSARPAGI